MTAIGATRDALWCQIHDDLESVELAIEREQRKISMAALGLCEECESGWIDQGGEDRDTVAPCPYCQPEKYGVGPWTPYIESATPSACSSRKGAE